MELVVASFLTAAILTWALPIALLALVGVYWLIVFRRRRYDEEA